MGHHTKIIQLFPRLPDSSPNPNFIIYFLKFLEINLEINFIMNLPVTQTENQFAHSSSIPMGVTLTKGCKHMRPNRPYYRKKLLTIACTQCIVHPKWEVSTNNLRNKLEGNDQLYRYKRKFIIFHYLFLQFPIKREGRIKHDDMFARS